MATSVKTTSYVHGQQAKDGSIVNRQARRIDVTEKNIAKVQEWIGAISELVTTSRYSKKPQPPKLKLKTEKGPRVVVPGDSILKFGTGAGSTYLVIKA